MPSPRDNATLAHFSSKLSIPILSTLMRSQQQLWSSLDTLYCRAMPRQNAQLPLLTSHSTGAADIQNNCIMLVRLVCWPHASKTFQMHHDVTRMGCLLEQPLVKLRDRSWCMRLQIIRDKLMYTIRAPVTSTRRPWRSAIMGVVPMSFVIL